MARPSMTHLIVQVRDMCALPADAPADHPDYLSDDALQTALDAHATLVIRQALYPIGAITDNIMHYARYALPATVRWIEGHGADSLWTLVDGTGTAAPAHAYDPATRTIVFEMPTDGRTYYLTTRAYDLHYTAAELWTQKAATTARRVNFSVDGQSVSAGDYHLHCLKMAHYFMTVDGASLSRRIRIDEV